MFGTFFSIIMLGNPLDFAVVQENIGGDFITESLDQILKKEGIFSGENIPLNLIKQLKEKYAFVAQDSSISMFITPRIERVSSFFLTLSFYLFIYHHN